MALGQFRSNVWDPLLIVSQIIAVQAVFYTMLGLWLVIVNLIINQPTFVSQMFDSGVGVSSLEGRMQICVFLLNSITSAFAIWFIVQRAKQCLDFTMTVHFFHFVVCCCVVGFPSSIIWWSTVVASIIVTSVLSEYLCMRYEMKAIPVTVSGVS